MSDQTEDFLFGGTGRAAKFDTIGDKVEGTIIDCRVTQQTSMDDNQPLTWSDGSPRMQLVVTLQTGEKIDENDDGLRRIFAKGGRYEVATGNGTSMKDAIADAVRKADSKNLTQGGQLLVAYTGEGKKTNRGFSAPKLYRARYQVPVAAVGEEDLFADEPPF